MPQLRRWLRPPRDLMMLFLLVMLAPAAALLALGLRLLEQDRAIERQRLTELRESAADHAVRALEQAISGTEKGLNSQPPADRSGDALRVVFHPGGIEASPPGRLLYYPVLRQSRSSPDGPFRQVEEYEFRQQDYQKAIELCLKLSSSPDPAVRAGALLRLARNLRKVGRQEAALDAYSRLGRIQSVTLEGIPADLLAMRARCAVLGEWGRTAERRDEATALQAKLQSGCWQLDRASYLYFSGLASTWSGTARQPEPAQEALAVGVEWLWQKWTRDRQDEIRQSGRQCLCRDGVAIVVLWQSTANRLVSLLAGPAYQGRNWFREISGSVKHRISLFDADRNLVFGDPIAEGSPQALRLGSDTGLPWTVRVTDADSRAALKEFSSRRRLLLAGLGLLSVLVVAGSYFIWRAMSRELAAARLQSDFVSAVSHEFRTPLTSLRQFNALLAEDRDLPDEQRREFRAAQTRATDRLQRLVESLLDFGRMEAGARPYRFESADAGALVEGVVEDFRKEAESGGFTIQCKAAPAVVYADTEAIPRALWNLLDNAMKYSGENRAIEVTLERRDGSIAISVRDHGPGIPPEEQKKIFHKFFRGAYAAEHHVRGTGIGLAMVRHIVDAHGGRIELASTPGEGSTFTILIPVGE
jgi:signal transduction histidine kinase